MKLRKKGLGKPQSTRAFGHHLVDIENLRERRGNAGSGGELPPPSERAGMGHFGGLRRESKITTDL